MTVLLHLVVSLALDGGLTPTAAGAKPGLEDLEVVENLDLLENLESSADFELLQELSVER